MPTQLSPSSPMPLTNPVIFARHETFHPRFGWLKKGIDQVLADGDLFLREDAPIRLGVGKNMVKSIRYWCLAFKVLEGDRSLKVSDFGRQLLADNGWDPFLEDVASLWLLHWRLLQAPCLATAWDIAFNRFHRVEFSADDLFLTLCDFRETVPNRIADSSLRKDLNCILRMYAEQPMPKTSAMEDSIDCPFTALRLLYPAGASKRYEFQMGAKDTLPAEILVAACLEFAQQVSTGQKTIALSRLTYEPGSPGLVFKVSEQAIAAAIETIPKKGTASILLSEGSGLLQLECQNDFGDMADHLLNTYYGR